MKINFVCHGNICRSPMAEFVMKDMVKKAGLEWKFEIASAATSTEEIGNPPHYGTRQELARRKVPLCPHRAKQITLHEAQCADLILAMDHANVRNLQRMLPPHLHHKIKLLLSFAGVEREIADPWYTGEFGQTYEDVFMGCTALLQTLQADQPL
jgi:protein-tyrosine phosphatase